MIEYTVEVNDNGSIFWHKDNQQHCEHGPAVEKANGVTVYFLNDERLTKEEWEERMNKSCSGKVVEIEGVKYKLVEVV